MEYKFEKEQEEIKKIIGKIKIISVLLTGKDLVPIKPTPEFTKKLIYNLWEEVPPESVVSRYDEYHICDNLYIKEEKVIGYLDKDFVDNVVESTTIEEEFYTLLNNILPELFPEYEDEFSHCFDALTSSKYNEGIKLFFNTINKLIKEGELEIEIEEIKKAKEEINEASGRDYLIFLEEFSQIVLDLLSGYIDREDVYSLVNDSVDHTMNSFMEDLEERINSVSDNIEYEIEYTDRGGIRIVFPSPYIYDLFNPNFTNLFYKVEDTLDDYIDTLKEEIEKATSIEELFEEAPNAFYYEMGPLITIIEMFSKEEPINEEEMMNILTELIIDVGDYHVDKVYPTELSLEICDLLKEIRREQGYGV